MDTRAFLRHYIETEFKVLLRSTELYVMRSGLAHGDAIFVSAMDVLNEMVVMDILALAERDPELDRMIAEFDDALLKEAREQPSPRVYANNNHRINHQEQTMTTFPVTTKHMTRPVQQIRTTGRAIRRFPAPRPVTLTAILVTALFGVLT